MAMIMMAPAIIRVCSAEFGIGLLSGDGKQ